MSVLVDQDVIRYVIRHSSYVRRIYVHTGECIPGRVPLLGYTFPCRIT